MSLSSAVAQDAIAYSDVLPNGQTSTNMVSAKDLNWLGKNIGGDTNEKLLTLIWDSSKDTGTIFDAMKKN